MAIQKKYICDSCGSHVTPENGVIGDKEFTIEKDGNGNKVCVQILISNLSENKSVRDNPVLCSNCLYATVEAFQRTGKNFRHI